MAGRKVLDSPGLWPILHWPLPGDTQPCMVKRPPHPRAASQARGSGSQAGMKSALMSKNPQSWKESGMALSFQKCFRNRRNLKGQYQSGNFWDESCKEHRMLFLGLPNRFEFQASSRLFAFSSHARLGVHQELMAWRPLCSRCCLICWGPAN